MISNLLKKVFGTSNNRKLKHLNKLVTEVNNLEAEISALSDEQLREKTAVFRARIQEGETFDAIMSEAFAVCREASSRALGMRHFDVQLIGGAVLHEGNIAEMRTGEGKTLVATLPAYLNALSGDAVHMVTVNDYLAKRDAQWMQPLYEFLGLTVGFNIPGMGAEEKAAAYQCDIVYGTNNEFGFDYLRDNMAPTLEDRVQRRLAFAIIDEVDSILIDEARTPLIISGPAEDSGPVYLKINEVIPSLIATPYPEALKNFKITARKVRLQLGSGEPEVITIEEAVSRAESQNMDLTATDSEKTPSCELTVKGHFSVDEKNRQIEINEDGHEIIEDWLRSKSMLKDEDSLYAAANLKLMHHVSTAVRAHALFRKDVDYIIENGQVVLIDEHTGRTMHGRRLSEGLHQAIEAKEGVAIQAESQTLASTTFQNYFRLYDKLSGMTGTADTEAPEFLQIYGLGVLVVPTNKPVNRQDLNDLIYMSRLEKYEAIVEDVKEYVAKGAPVLVGTASIETSEQLHQFMTSKGIKHEVLNAKFHEKEASIIAQAGRPGAVTIATNMAGRGTDIVLGGNLEVELAGHENISDSKRESVEADWKIRHTTVIEAGGLHVLGTERHESRRIDNQLRGRSGRQGDPGVSRFYLSLEDDLMRIFASDRMRGIMQALGMEKGEAIEHKMVTNAIEKAQRKVEGRNFDARKALLEYDDVANDQRQIVYDLRNTLLEESDLSDSLKAIRLEVVSELVCRYVMPNSVYEQWDIDGLVEQLKREFLLDLPIQQWLDDDKALDSLGLAARLEETVQQAYEQKCEQIGEEMRRVEKYIMLQLLDQYWKEHLATMDQLRAGIHLRGYAGKNPKQEYKRESFDLFEQLLKNWRSETISLLSKIELREKNADTLEEERQQALREQQAQMTLKHDDASAMGIDNDAAQVAPSEAEQPLRRAEIKVGRNEPCPCGSGKKYKQCHGKLA